MKKVFLFPHVRLSGVKVSHAMVVGLPSLTGLTGLAGAFSAGLAQAAGLHATELTNSGVLLAFDQYKLHEGYKKITEKGAGAALAHRALASAFASFNAYFILEVQAQTPAAKEVLANMDLNDLARDVMRSLKLCGASMLEANRPVRLSPQKVQDLGGERAAALAMLPSRAKVLVDASSVVGFLRSKGLPGMESLMAATLPHAARPPQYQAAFDEVAQELQSEHQHVYGVVHDGYLLVGDANRLSNRADFHGERLPVKVASPTLSLVRLQTAASLRIAPAWEDGVRPSDFAFWCMQEVEGGFLCRPRA